MSYANKKLIIWAIEYINNKKKIFLKKKIDLSIIIFSYQRPDCLIRSIAYWAYKSVKIIIVDGSTKPVNKYFIDEVKKITNISYYHLPNRSIPERIKFGAKKSKTSFTMCLADDDFYLDSGLTKGIEMLKKKKYLVACMGQSAGLDYLLNKPYLFQYGESLKKYKTLYKNNIIRLRQTFKHYIPATFYAIFKTSVFKKIWKNINTFPCQELYEYEQAIRTYLEGNLLIIKDRYWIRSFKYRAISNKKDGNRKLTFSKWFKKNDFYLQRKFFTYHLSKHISNKTLLNMNKSKTLLNEIFELIYNNKNSLYENHSKFYSYIILLKKIIEKSFFSKYLTYFKNSKSGLSLIQFIKYYFRKKILKSKKLKINEKEDLIKLFKFLNSCPD